MSRRKVAARWYKRNPDPHSEGRCRQFPEHERCTDDDRTVDEHVTHGSAKCFGYLTLVRHRHAVELAVEPAEEAFFLLMSVGIDRFQNRCTERRRQGQCQKCRECHRCDHRNRELSINGTNRTTEECHRDENGCQDKGNTDNSPCDLAIAL